MFKKNSSLYPTPDWLIDKMLSKVELRSMRNILEPSAGFGNIIERIQYKLGSSNMQYCNIDAIEIENINLVPILKSKGIRVIHDNFLTFDSMKHYDMIIMNPDFSEGDKHLLKAIDIQSRSGGEIICLLNAESIRNAYSNTRKDLANKLHKYNAEIEFIEDAFSGSESLRKTNVTVALIRINIETKRDSGVIVDHLRAEEKFLDQQVASNKVVSGDFIDRVIAQYNFESKAGVKLINEYENIMPMLSRSFDDKNCILELQVYDENNNRSSDSLVNKFIKKIRYKYWSTLFQSKEFRQLLTTDLHEQYMAKIEELQNYDFSKYNIEQIKLDINIMLSQSIEKTIYELFEDFTHKYSYSREYDNNIHMYNGWISNDCYKLNDRKTIIPLSGYNSWDGRLDYSYSIIQKLQDIEKVFNYLDGGKTDNHESLHEILKQAQANKQTKKIDTKYAYITLYKKGTCHMEWKDKDLIKKFNIFGCKYGNNLPPSYGKPYNDMTDKEKAVIDSFEGKESYEEVVSNKGYYLSSTSQMLALEGGI